MVSKCSHPKIETICSGNVRMRARHKAFPGVDPHFRTTVQCFLWLLMRTDTAPGSLRRAKGPVKSNSSPYRLSHTHLISFLAQKVKH